MKQGSRYHVKLRRHRSGRTDYRRRLKLLKSRKTRIVVRKSSKNIRVQFVEYYPEGDKVLVSAISDELIKNYNWKYSAATTPASYLTGLLAGKKASDKGIKEGILDMGRYRPTTGNKLFAALKGVIDAGIECPYDSKKIPAEDRILGKHLNKEMPPVVGKIKSNIIGGK
ncbi:MAG: 50S ribosomal protein L18 [Thermoplasmatales archaeon]|nr:MAG: 50S ribosomal protein L18 [Thermoplasmatales archaeon]